MTKHNTPSDFQPGQRVRLVSMSDDPDPIAVGATGTIVNVRPLSDWSQIDVDWDNGRALMLSIPPDEIERIESSNDARSC
ncbi:MAG: DUF4314 domain-containing protein [Pirellulaceae bacterium]|nr:DUF4314 domain-containing protein [Pirellulaceae bacterium]